MLADLKQSPTTDWIAQLRQQYPTERYVDAALTRKLNNRAGAPHRSPTVETVIERLKSFLDKRVSKPFELRDVRALTGGSSKEQFRFELETTDADGRKR